MTATRRVRYDELAVGMRLIGEVGLCEIVDIKEGDESPYGRHKRLTHISGGERVIRYAFPEQPVLVASASAPTSMPARTTYTIPVIDVVPGMDWHHLGHNYGMVRSVEPHGDVRWISTGHGSATRRWGRLCAESATISLPGPSPRELRCRCPEITGLVDRYPLSSATARLLAPECHHADCPVTPRPGVHGGMRLWPAPFKGEPWVYMPRRLAWRSHKALPEVWPNALRQSLSAWMPGWRDAVLSCFFLPPTPATEPDRRIPGPLADDADLEMVAARVGRGEVKAVRR